MKPREQTALTLADARAWRRAVRLSSVLLLAGSLVTAGAEEQQIDFHRDVQPILEQNCVSCHLPGDDKGGLMMHTREAMLKGGDHAKALVPGDPDASELLVRVTLPHDDADIMPPRGEKLDESQVNILRAWIEQGAPMPADVVLREVTADELRRVAEMERKAPKIRDLHVYPDHIQLKTLRDFQQVVALAVLDDDTTLDVSNFVELELADEGIVRVEGTTLHPAGDGSTVMRVSLAGHESRITIDVADAAEDRPVSFYLDVMPVFLREHCNSGGCHGAARGQDMFMLSLFGYDPEGDHHRITREMAGRRLNFAQPERSLLVEKSVQSVPHSGGQLFDENSHAYATLIEWISDGAPNDIENKIPVSRIELMPEQMVLEGPQSSQQVVVRAHYKDGTSRDVTHLAVMSSTNETAADVDGSGLVTAAGPGEAFVLARYEFHTVTAQVLVVPPDSGGWHAEMSAGNYIDEHINAKLRRLRIRPSDLCGDEEFVRRAHIDLAGRLPDPQTVLDFVSDGSPDKRARLIDHLLEQPDFNDLWVMKWAELLQIHSNDNERRYYDGVLRYHDWLRGQFEANRPINAVVRDLIASVGSTYDNPATMFYEMERDTLLLTENVAQVFMGMRIQCAQCHNHPFDRWTMDDYYGFAAFFAQVGRKNTDNPGNRVIFNSRSGGVRHFLTGGDVEPRFLGGGEAEVERGEDRRAVLAEWLTSPDNEFFARNIANIVWQHHLGIGIVEPVDDVRISNPPSNPELLDALTAKLVEYDFDLRQLVRDITNSHAYQRETRANETNSGDERNFSKAMIRRMRAEVLLDSIAQVTETTLDFPGVREGTRSVQIADGQVNNFFLTTFGRSSRETVCSCEVEVEPNLSQALHLLNGPAVHNRIRDGGVIQRMIREGEPPGRVVDELYLRCYGRTPTTAEMEAIQAYLDAAEGEAEVMEVLEDVFWALLNSKEFIFNH